MNVENAKKLQGRIMWEAIALHTLGGDAVQTGHYDKCVNLIGKAWGVSAADTESCLNLIAKERTVVRGVTHPDAVVNLQHIRPETELPINATGAETMENVWGLFETAIRMDDAEERKSLFDMACELAELHTLNSWIIPIHSEQDPAEQSIN